MRWNDLTQTQQEEIIDAYEKEPSYKTLVSFSDYYDIPVPTLQRRCQEELAGDFEFEGEGSEDYGASEPPPSPLSNLYWIDPQTDQGAFVDKLHELQSSERYVRVMHACDFHFPYHHEGATKLFYDIVRAVQPHLIAVGSDSADFAMISHFDKDKDEDNNEDVLDEFAQYYVPHIHEIHAKSPQASLFFILGNHEKRIYDYVLNRAPELRNTIWSRFVEIVRCGGLVHWLGETDFTRIGPLVVMHGNRTTTNAAKSMLEDLGYQASVMAGHVHRLSRWERRGEDFSVVAVTSGCHCIYPAHYSKRKRMAQKWQLGTAIAEVDLQGREVQIENLEYLISQNSIGVNYRGQRFYAENSGPKGTISYNQYLAERSGQEKLG